MVLRQWVKVFLYQNLNDCVWVVSRTQTLIKIVYSKNMQSLLAEYLCQYVEGFICIMIRNNCLNILINNWNIATNLNLFSFYYFFSISFFLLYWNSLVSKCTIFRGWIAITQHKWILFKDIAEYLNTRQCRVSVLKIFEYALKPIFNIRSLLLQSELSIPSLEV